MKFLLAMTALFAAAPQTGAPPDPIVLELPVRCDIGTDCFVQNYFDHDPSARRYDYACGRLSYDGHDGTDFRAATMDRMNQGVPVTASAAGTVIGVRDGEPDISVRERGRDSVTGREAGNGVNIRHGGGWTTQYSHLKEGSVRVAVGDLVEPGDVLGEIGLSGLTEFPHMHLSVRHQGEEIDPFVGRTGGYQCGEARDSLWSEAAAQALEYQATGLLDSGSAATAPKSHDARAGLYTGEEVSRERPLVFWVDLFGAQAGDDQTFRIEGPDGVVLDNEISLENSNVSWFAFAGERPPETGWTPGEYTASYELVRDGRTLVRHSESVTID